MSGWRQRAYEWGLIFCAAIGIYFASLLLASRLSLALAQAARSLDSTLIRVLLGVAALDLVKGPALLLAAAVIGPALRVRPWISASALVLLTYGLEAIVASVLGQAPWLFAAPAVLACRFAAAFILVWITAIILRRRRRPVPDGERARK